jgi:membrane protease YdiL (CAAX protease family)
MWPYAWIAVLLVPVVSAIRRRETPRVVGLSLSRFRSGALPVAASLSAVVAAGLTLGILSGTIRRASAGAVALVLVLYCFWGLFQQYILNGYLVHRLNGTFGGQRRLRTAAISGAIFAIVHMPNPFLMAVTFSAGFAAAIIYLRHRNLLLLGVAHGVLGCLIWVAVPDEVSHHLYVGPNCIKYCHASNHAHAAGKNRLSGALLDPTTYSFL